MISNPSESLHLNNMLDAVAIMRGYVASVNLETGTLAVTLSNGAKLSAVKPIHENILGVQSMLNSPDSGAVKCLVVVIGEGLLQEAICLGVFGVDEEDGKSPLASEDYIPGDQGFANIEKHAHIVLRKSGVIELKAAEAVQIKLNPKTNKVQVVANNFEYLQSPDNHLTMALEEDPLTGATTKASLDLTMKPNMATEDKVSLKINTDGVTLNSDLNVSVKTKGNARLEADGEAIVKAPKVIVDGDLYIGGTDADDPIAKGNETAAAIKAVADALIGMMNNVANAGNAAIVATPVAPNSGAAAMTAALLAEIASFTIVMAQFQNFVTVKSLKHKIKE